MYSMICVELVLITFVLFWCKLVHF